MKESTYFLTFSFQLSTLFCTFAAVFQTTRKVAQLVAYHVRDVGVGSSSLLFPTIFH